MPPPPPAHRGTRLRRKPTRLSASALGAYGFRIFGCEGGLQEVPREWPALHLEFDRIEAGDGPEIGTIRISDELAEISMGGSARVEVSPRPPGTGDTSRSFTVRFRTCAPLRPEAVVHPFLGLPAAVAAHWLGRFCLHGGAFEHEGRAWALLGPRSSGKSSTLAHLMSIGGCAVVTDDILIVDGTTAFSGPRSIDLREEAAELGGEPLGVVGTRQRWRLHPPDGPPSLPLGGLIQPRWDDRATIAPLGPRERLQLLVANAVFVPGEDAARPLLGLTALPAIDWARPDRLTSLGDAAAALLAALPES